MSAPLAGLWTGLAVRRRGPDAADVGAVAQQRRVVELQHRIAFRLADCAAWRSDSRPLAVTAAPRARRAASRSSSLRPSDRTRPVSRQWRTPQMPVNPRSPRGAASCRKCCGFDKAATMTPAPSTAVASKSSSPAERRRRDSRRCPASCRRLASRARFEPLPAGKSSRQTRRQLAPRKPPRPVLSWRINDLPSGSRPGRPHPRPAAPCPAEPAIPTLPPRAIGATFVGKSFSQMSGRLFSRANRPRVFPGETP